MSDRDDRSDQTITLEGEDGRSYTCRILGIFDVDRKDYALLLKLGDNDDDKGGVSTVLMRLIETKDGAILRTIESDEEFQRVVACIKELAVTEDPQQTDRLT